jgi:cell division protein FtsN
MRRIAQRLVLIALAAACVLPLGAQDAEAIRQRRELEEQLKAIQNLQSDLQQVLAKQLTLEKRLADLQEELRQQKAEDAREAGRYLTREELKRLDADLLKLASSIKEVDKARIADNEKLVEQLRNAISEMSKVIKLSTQAQISPPSEGPKTPSKKEKEKGKEPEEKEKAPAPPEKIKAFTHKVAAGENLSVIIQAYNAKLKEEGATKRITLDMVLKANPGLKPERMQIGQEILIPDPRD